MTLRNLLLITPGAPTGRDLVNSDWMYFLRESDDNHEYRALVAGPWSFRTQERYYPDKHGGWSDWQENDFTAEQIIANNWFLKE